MKRIQLFEFEDFQWFPNSFRMTMTKLLNVLQKMMGVEKVIANLLLEAKQKTNFTRVVDLGSGSGGAMPMAIAYLNSQFEAEIVDLLLTDLHPNAKLAVSFNSDESNSISYQEESLDAVNLDNTPEGIKTMINSFHHMPPKIASEILASAQKNKESILIYELGENKVPVFVWGLLLPITLPILAIMSIFMLPFIKPLTFKDILFTWLIPLVPIFYAWDGQASLPRTYTFEDIEELLPPSDNEYTWEVKPAEKENGKKLGYYILGMPNF
ncbi:hypothetical protein [Sediminitomix flava]|uniref:Methyltransferase family protein n=1 Tax=Sediminitomix flava TaxID=379075 RepID=A0A315ZFL1_SEDFL|nr:hypothetical protein [Sediminitomix flava]PWJ44376.1 hypothetical protein BC781_101726 [Sediminitomix flava]